MADVDLRELERRAALGDANAVHALDRARDRLGLGWNGEVLPEGVVRGPRSPLYLWRTGRGLRVTLEFQGRTRLCLASQAPCFAPDSPFADAVRRGATDEAMHLLRAAEERHGVSVARSTGSCAAAGNAWPRDGRARSAAETLALLQDPERFWGVFGMSADDGVTPLESSEQVDERILAVLDETGLVLGGMDFTNEHVWLTRTGGVAAWSQRAWGSTLADWVARSVRPVVEGTGLGYVEMAFFADDVVVDYDAWREATLPVIAEKTEREARHE